MAGGDIHAEHLAHSAQDPEHGREACSEEDEVEASYKENFAGNAQAAVDEFMSNMDFLERESELVYVVPKGICMHTLITGYLRDKAFFALALSRSDMHWYLSLCNRDGFQSRHSHILHSALLQDMSKA